MINVEHSTQQNVSQHITLRFFIYNTCLAIGLLKATASEVQIIKHWKHFDMFHKYRRFLPHFIL
jgi:hypothetical protein